MQDLITTVSNFNRFLGLSLSLMIAIEAGPLSVYSDRTFSSSYNAITPFTDQALAPQDILSFINPLNRLSAGRARHSLIESELSPVYRQPFRPAPHVGRRPARRVFRLAFAQLLMLTVLTPVSSWAKDKNPWTLTANPVPPNVKSAIAQFVENSRSTETKDTMATLEAFAAAVIQNGRDIELRKPDERYPLADFFFNVTSTNGAATLNWTIFLESKSFMHLISSPIYAPLAEFTMIKEGSSVDHLKFNPQFYVQLNNELLVFKEYPRLLTRNDVMKTIHDLTYAEAIGYFRLIYHLREKGFSAEVLDSLSKQTEDPVVRATLARHASVLAAVEGLAFTDPRYRAALYKNIYDIEIKTLNPDLVKRAEELSIHDSDLFPDLTFEKEFKVTMSRQDPRYTTSSKTTLLPGERDQLWLQLQFAIDRYNRILPAIRRLYDGPDDGSGFPADQIMSSTLADLITHGNAAAGAIIELYKTLNAYGISRAEVNEKIKNAHTDLFKDWGDSVPSEPTITPDPASNFRRTPSTPPQAFNRLHQSA